MGKGLLQVMVYPKPAGGLGVAVSLVGAGNDDNRECDPAGGFAEFVEELGAAQDRELQVEHEEVDSFPGKNLQCFLAGFCRYHVEPLTDEKPLQDQGKRFIVFCQ